MPLNPLLPLAAACLSVRRRSSSLITGLTVETATGAVIGTETEAEMTGEGTSVILAGSVNLRMGAITEGMTDGLMAATTNEEETVGKTSLPSAPVNALPNQRNKPRS